MAIAHNMSFSSIHSFTSFLATSLFSPLQALHEIMPRKAKTMMDRLIQLSQDAVIKLEGDPTSTIDYVNLLRFVHTLTVHVCLSNLQSEIHH